MILIMPMIKRILKYFLNAEWYNWCYNLIVLQWHGVRIGKFHKLSGRLLIKNRGIILIGENVRINSGKKYNIIGGDVYTNLLVGLGACLRIGDNVGISNSTIVCHNAIDIEDDVLIGGGCKIYDTDFHSLKFDQRVKPFFRLNKQSDDGVKTSPIKISKGAWIGGHCIILKGVTIGEESIIGAGSVVTKSVPKHEVWAGNPARFIKSI